MTLDTFQLGEPVEHRGIVVTPALPPPRPGRGLRHARRGAAARAPDHGDVRLRLRARALRREPHRQRRAALRRRGARRREAEPDPQRQRPRRRGREAADPRLVRRAGTLEPASDAFGSARHISHSHLRRRKAEMLAAQPLALGLAQGDVWDEVREKQDADGRPLRPRRTATRSRRTRRGSRARGSRSRSPRAVRRRARGRRRPLPRRRLAARRVRAPLAEAPRRLPARRARAARRPRDIRRADLRLRRRASATRATRGPSAGLGEDVRLRGARVIGSGLELDGETIQLSAFTSDDGGARAFGRIARPSARR